MRCIPSLDAGLVHMATAPPDSLLSGNQSPKLQSLSLRPLRMLHQKVFSFIPVLRPGISKVNEFIQSHAVRALSKENPIMVPHSVSPHRKMACCSLQALQHHLAINVCLYWNPLRDSSPTVGPICHCNNERHCELLIVGNVQSFTDLSPWSHFQGPGPAIFSHVVLNRDSIDICSSFSS